MIINNDNFLIKEIPNFHPISQKYDRLQFWQKEKRRSIEGFWTSGKWMPGTLYYYINYHTINIESLEVQGRMLGRPWLRDIEWEKAYIYEEACGFSGFTLDTKHTCDRRYGPEKDISLMMGYITEEEINSKVYVPAREYLRRNHGKSLGKPLYRNQAKNVIDLEARGGGKSFWASSLIAHNFLFDGATDYDIYLEQQRKKLPLKSDTVVGAVEAKFSSDLLKKFRVALENLPGRVDIGGEIFESPFFRTYSGSLAPSKDFFSTRSESVIHHRSFGDDPLAANGTRPNRAFLEEVGFLGSIIEVWGALEATQQSSEFRNLVIYGLGTGGLTKAGAALYAKEVFYNPEDYNCLAFDDEWENKGKIGFFLPAAKTLNKFKEGPNLITNEEKALKYIEHNRAKAKKSNSKLRYITERINAPLNPSEIFLTTEGGIFPIEDLNDRLSNLEADSRTLNSTYKVRFNLLEGRPSMVISDKGVIREFPVRRGVDLDAAVELFELPKKDADGNVPYGRYLAGWDPVEVDGNDDFTQSLQSLYILDSWTNRIVADYTARTRIAEDYYEQVRRLLMHYNAICNVENNIKGPYGYFRNKNSLHLLCETPEILKEQNFVKGSGIGNKGIGTRVNAEIINYGLGLSVSWLDELAYGKEEEGIRNIDQIESPGLLKEMIAFDKDINADRVSAFGMLMILREDRRRITANNISKRVKTKTDDRLWDRPFNKKIYGFEKGFNSLKFQ
jgi:hypothetical protein